MLEGELMNRYGHVCILRSLLAAAILITFGGRSQAQVDTGSITGIVTDTSGAVVNGARVTLTNEGTGTALSTTTAANGTYDFSPVRIGNYRLDVAAPGFKTAVQNHVVVDVSARVSQDFKLQPGAVSETVEVTAGAPVLQSQDASVGQVVDQRTVNDIPLNGRNFTFLAQLAAGVNSPQADTRGNASTGAFAANGNRPAQNNYMLDGIDNNSDTVDFLNGTNFVVLPPVDAIQEFKVATSDFSAEYGRSGAAVLNATVKSGTNQFHGNVWEFFRNDKLDAADYFEDANHIKKGELRQNQFGGTFGGPVIKNKIFFFADYEGLRRIQGTVLTGSVPTAAEASSNYTDFSDLINLQSGSTCKSTNSNICTDQLGRTMPYGTILDPSTTRKVTAGVLDPVSGITPTAATLNNATSAYVRDPIGTCAPSTTAFTLSGCKLNNLSALPAGRIDLNAIALLKLYPSPTGNTLFSNFASSPKLDEHSNAFDTRVDLNLSDKNQLFYRFSYKDDPIFIPGIFGGVADGGAFQQGNQTALAQQSALAYTHVFSANLINVARAGLNYLHTTRAGPVANDLSDLPSKFGIPDIPQTKENGGLPAFGINGLSTLGSNAFLPSDEVSSTFQLTDDLTKIYGKHTFKMGFEWQHVKFSTLQPPWSHGEFDYNGDFTEVPKGITDSDLGNTGRAAFLLTPIASTVTGGVPFFVGGSTNVYASNISLTDNGKNYYGIYFNDDWKVTPKLTVNLGLRWDFFGLVYEHHGAQANFVPSGPPTGQPMYILQDGANPSGLSTSFLNLLAQNGIALPTSNKYGKGIGNSQKSNFAPRVGFAYQATPKFVARGGFGIFFNGFENRGFSPNLGENYPFQFNFNYTPPDDGTPHTFSGCAAAAPVGFTATFESGFACTPLDPTAVFANGLGLRGIQFNYQTPYTMSGNFTLQYQLTPTLTAQAGYVTSLARHLEVFPNSNNPTQILPTNTPLTNSSGVNGASGCPPPADYPTSGCGFPAALGGLPFPDFGQGSSYAITAGNSYYHGLQTKVEKRFAHGFNFLATYTWSKTRTDAVDLLNNGSGQGYRAPDVPGVGIHYDYGLAPFDIRNVFHFSGEYELPFGKGKPYLASGGAASRIFGGWTVVPAIVLQGGQPITLTCPSGTSSGSNCYNFVVPGQSQARGIHIDANGKPSFFGNPKAFAQPPACTALPCPLSTLGGPPSQIAGPPYKRMDFSVFKNFPLTERFRLEFRSEFFNIFNHPNFNAPNFGGNGVVAVAGSGDFTNSAFGEIGSTRDAPYDPRQIQFALKLYF
jgi:Carboxypeptidase regulatory-like domain/TonB dependent receptor